MKQDIPYMVRLLSHGMLSQQGDAGVTALARAVELDMPVATEFLLQNGVDVDATTDVARNTPLHIATRLSHIDCVKILLRHSADHMLKNNDKQVALDYAIANNDDGCCTLINGTSCNSASSPSHPLHFFIFFLGGVFFCKHDDCSIPPIMGDEATNLISVLSSRQQATFADLC